MAEKETALAKVEKSPRVKKSIEKYQDDPLIMLAVQKDFDIARLEKLIEMRDREDAKKSKRAFDAAFAFMQAEVDTIIRNKKAKKPRDSGEDEEMYSYATIGAAKTQIQEVLTRHGFAFRWSNPKVDHATKWVSITFVLSGHGHEEKTPREGPILLPTKRQNALQALEGTYTYLKRYSMWDGLGLASDDDDRDGAGKTPLAEPQEKKAKDAADDVRIHAEALKTLYKRCYKSQLFNDEKLTKMAEDSTLAAKAGDIKKMKSLKAEWEKELDARGRKVNSK